MNGAISGILGAEQAWRSVILQNVRQNRRLPPRMGIEFGCKICILCADT